MLFTNRFDPDHMNVRRVPGGVDPEIWLHELRFAGCTYRNGTYHLDFEDGFADITPSRERCEFDGKMVWRGQEVSESFLCNVATVVGLLAVTRRGRKILGLREKFWMH